MKLLLLEDETVLQESIEEFLISKGYSVDSFDNSNDAFNAIFSKNYDLLLLDVNIPGEWNGFALSKELVDKEKNIPTIFVTSLSSADAMLRGYATGCCDYIKKPFDLVELQLRVQYALKASYFNTSSDLVELCTDYSYNTINYSLIHKGEEVSLSKNEHKFIEILAQNRDSTVSNEQICYHVWYRDESINTLRALVHRIREKVDISLIKNIKGIGYITYSAKGSDMEFAI